MFRQTNFYPLEDVHISDTGSIYKLGDQLKTTKQKIRNYLVLEL